MYFERTVLDLIGLVYDAAGDERLWPVFLERLSQVLKSPTVNLAIQEFTHSGEKNVFDLGSLGLDQGFYRTYLEYYGARNPSLIRGGQFMKQGEVYRHAELCPKEELIRTEFYNDWMRPQRMSHALFGIVLKEKGLVAFTNAVRYLGARPFSEDDLDLLRVLNPRLQRAVQLHLKMLEIKSREESVAGALDRWNMGVILLNNRGGVILMNRSAENILRNTDGLVLRGGGISAMTRKDTLTLRNMIVSAAAATSYPVIGYQPGGTYALLRHSGKRPLEVLVTPACANPWFVPAQGAAVIVFVNDPEEMPESDLDIIRRLYGFSRAEADVAVLLLQGKTIKEITEELHVSRDTAKTHLSRLFDKTGTRRQAELLRLLLRGPASLLTRREIVPAASKKQAS